MHAIWQALVKRYTTYNRERLYEPAERKRPAPVLQGRDGHGFRLNLHLIDENGMRAMLKSVIAGNPSGSLPRLEAVLKKFAQWNLPMFPELTDPETTTKKFESKRANRMVQRSTSCGLWTKTVCTYHPTPDAGMTSVYACLG